MPDQKSLWELESDIFTDYEGTITEATFKFGEFGGQFSITVDEIDGRDAPTWENYRLPPGWESNDGGETIDRVSGDGKGITKGSQYGRFLASVAGCNGALDALGEDAPVNASAWIGCRFYFEVTEVGKGKAYKFTDEKDGQVKEGVSKDKNYPTVFVGKDSQVVDSAPATSNGKVDALSVLFTLNDPIAQEKIKDAAKELTHKEWFSACYKIVTDAGGNASTHGDLIAAMGDRGLYESLGGKG